MVIYGEGKGAPLDLEHHLVGLPVLVSIRDGEAQHIVTGPVLRHRRRCVFLTVNHDLHVANRKRRHWLLLASPFLLIAVELEEHRVGVTPKYW